MKKIKQTFQKKLTALGLDLTVDQWVILDQLKNEKELSQQEICQLTYKDAPTVTRILDLMVKKGLIDRKMNGQDRRKFAISLTENGKSMHQTILPEAIKMRISGWNTLNEDDMHSLFRILKTVHQNMVAYGDEEMHLPILPNG